MTTFTAPLELHGKTATGIEVPADVVASLGAGKRVPVTVTFNGFSYPTTIAPYNGVYLIPVRSEVREAAGASAGDLLDVTIEVDTSVRSIEVPADLARLLTANPKARTFFDSLSLSNQRGFVDWIESAKKDETRQARLAKTLEALLAERKTH